MEKEWIEDIILQKSQRGMTTIRPYVSDFFCKDAAEEILSWKKGTVILTTGFYVEGHAETDGPAGTVILARVLQRLGYEVLILSDFLTQYYFESVGLQTHYMNTNDGQEEYIALLNKINPVGLISIERCGKNIDGIYANMRGVNISAYTASIDEIFELALDKGIPTIAIGDGGNEIGMGNVSDIIQSQLSLVPCIRKVKHLVIATVSNWGAYGLAAYLSIMMHQNMMDQTYFLSEYINKTLELGSVDGVTKQHTHSVDGFASGVEERIYEQLYNFVVKYCDSKSYVKC